MKNYLRILWSTLVNFVHSGAFFPQLQLQWKNGQQVNGREWLKIR